MSLCQQTFLKDKKIGRVIVGKCALKPGKVTASNGRDTTVAPDKTAESEKEAVLMVVELDQEQEEKSQEATTA